jgi:hypothetical protein
MPVLDKSNTFRLLSLRIPSNLKVIKLLLKSMVSSQLKEKMEESPENFSGKSADDIQEMNYNNVEHMLSPSTVFPLSLFSLLLLGMIYSFFVMAFNRLILSKL